MQLQGRLRSTSLGDLLGALFRANASGTLELTELHGRIHRVHVARGGVAAVEVDRATASLAEVLRRDDLVDEDTIRRSLLRAMASRRLHGEVLVREFRLSHTIVDRALRQQLRLRLHVLDRLVDAQVTFRVAMRPPRGALADEPLTPEEFLHGRRRARDRMHNATPRPEFVSRDAGAPLGLAPSFARKNALIVLGLEDSAEDTDIKRAYRRLVRAYHPDLHPHASDEERRALAARFHEVTAAYQALVA